MAYARRLLCVFLFVAGGIVPAVRAQEGEFARHLAAGEFGPARLLAESMPANLRDRWLGQLAQQQALAGARTAASSSLRSMGDDQSRYDAVQSMRDGRIGDGMGRGGAAMADFDSLIDLITTTVEPQSWDDVGGPGAIESFPGGVLVDGEGVLRRIETAASDTLDELRKASEPAFGSREIRRESPLRKVSLNRLERELQILAAEGRDPSEAMRNLAGIHKVKYLFLYPETGDVVIAGPAGAWRENGEGRSVHARSGSPTLQLEDLVVMLRIHERKDSTFGCSITPTREGLAAMKAFAADSSNNKVSRATWLSRLQSTLGRQKIEVFGLDARTRAARVLVEADYRMKLVGMGLEEGVKGVSSYLSMLKLGEDGSPPPMSVLRWWFTLNYDAITATKGRDAYELRGPGVKVLSENELLTERGERVHTGKSDEPTREFARSFTRHFPQLAEKYPIYSELRNVFDLALVSAIIQREGLADKAEWHMAYLRDKDGYPVALRKPPAEVETVVGHRVLNRRVTVAGVSGGVTANAHKRANAIEADTYGLMKADRAESKPPAVSWWWD